MAAITRGVGKIEIGTIAVDGGVATTWATLGYTDRDSTAALTEEDPTREELFALEVDTAVDVDTTGGAITLTYSILNPDTATLAALWGGTVTGTGNAATWSRPGTAVSLEKSVKITPKKGLTITIVRGSVVPKLNFDLTKAGKFVIDIVVTVLQPTKANVDPVLFGPLIVPA